MRKKTRYKFIENRGLGFNPFVNASHTDAERHYFGKDHPFPCESRSLSHGNTRASLAQPAPLRPSQVDSVQFQKSVWTFETDSFGSVRAVMNSWDSPLRTYDYDVFGQPLQDRPERFRNSDPVDWLNPWGLDTCPYAQSGEDPIKYTNSNEVFTESTVDFMRYTMEVLSGGNEQNKNKDIQS